MNISRRNIIRLLASAPALTVLSPHLSAKEADKIITRIVPSTGEVIPVVGMGTYQTFNVLNNVAALANLKEVLQVFFLKGGRLIDSSPMYGHSESVIGELVSQLTSLPAMFAASKVWTYGKSEGMNAIKESARRMRVKKMDLMQVHNLRDWKVQLSTLNALKEKGEIRYTGITTSRLSQYKAVEDVMRSQKIDFVQLNFNIKVREAEKRLIPLARDRGIAVIVNMPFEKARLFKLVKGQALPRWSRQFDCQSWGQFFLKFIIANPAVSCVIPATSKVHHMQDNMQALLGRLPDRKMRKKMSDYFENL